MFPRAAAVTVSLVVGLAGCATTFTHKELARAQEMNQYSMDMMQQSAIATQNANLVMMMNMNAAMIQPVMIPPPAPTP